MISTKDLTKKLARPSTKQGCTTHDPRVIHGNTYYAHLLMVETKDITKY
jgi:hypothetical protein